MMENAALLLCWGQGGGLDPSVAFFIIDGIKGVSEGEGSTGNDWKQLRRLETTGNNWKRLKTTGNGWKRLILFHDWVSTES